MIDKIRTALAAAEVYFFLLFLVLVALLIVALVVAQLVKYMKPKPPGDGDKREDEEET